jgi:hypothetical protein
MPVTLWGERADAFDANSVYNAGQTQAQVIVFVGTLVKDYTGLGSFSLRIFTSMLFILAI